MALNRLRKEQFFSVGELKEETSAGNICLRWLKCFPAPPVPISNREALQYWSWDHKWPIMSIGATNIHMKVGEEANSHMQSVQAMKERAVPLSFHAREDTDPQQDTFGW